MKRLSAGPQASFSRAGGDMSGKILGPSVQRGRRPSWTDIWPSSGLLPIAHLRAPLSAPAVLPTASGWRQSLRLHSGIRHWRPQSRPPPQGLLPAWSLRCQACPLAPALPAGLHGQRSAEVGTHKWGTPPSSWRLGRWARGQTPLCRRGMTGDSGVKSPGKRLGSSGLWPPSH